MADRVYASIQPQHLQSRFRHEASLEIYSPTSHPAADQISNRDLYNSCIVLPQLPQQYVLPIRSAQYDRVPVAVNDGQQRHGNPEHFLRRKTPCDTLTAAYDGSSVESSGDRHAVKRLLLSVANSNGDAKYANKPIMNYVQPQVDFKAAGVQDIDKGHGGVWTPDGIMPTEYGLASRQGKHGLSFVHSTNQPPPVISMMNQNAPQFSPNHRQYDAHPTAKAIQPPCQMPRIATVSNDPVSYWPCPAFVPYHPAASPDPRYMPCTNNAVNDFNQYAVLPDILPKFSKSGYSMVDSQLGAASLHQMNSVVERQPADVRFIPCTNIVKAFPANKIQDGSSVPPSRYPLQPSTNNSRLREVERETNLKRNTLTFRERQSSRTVTPPYTGVSAVYAETVRYPYRVLAWARTAYENLLSAVHRAQRGGHIWRSPISQASTPRLNIFSQRSLGAAPPFYMCHNQYGRCIDIPNQVHTCANLRQRSSHLGTYASHSLQTESSHLCQSCLRDQGKACYCTSTSCNSACGRHSNFSFSLDLDGTTTAHIKHVHNWHEPCTAPELPVPSFLAQKADPRCNAVAALEALTKLCEVSDPIWIDATLLAGCLSYLLEDYQQAFRYFSMILEQDPK